MSVAPIVIGYAVIVGTLGPAGLALAAAHIATLFLPLLRRRKP